MEANIHHYRIISEIGRGAMGRVYLAYDEVIQRNVAIKELILPDGMEDQERQEAIERFKREAQAAGRLSHPNIITIHSVEEEHGVPFIVMEYLEGTTLGQLMRSGPLDPSRAIDIASQICNALAYAHEREVVHRDIKPDNIFLLYDGRVKVADFGIARVMGSSTMTQAGTVMGSPGYMSPEQVRGERTDARTDIFATGVILYEMLSGINPFASDTPTSVMYKVVHEDPLLLSFLNPSLPAFLSAIIAKATAKSKEDRYQDAAQMNRDLLAGRAPEASTPATVVLGPASPGKVHVAPQAPPPEGTMVRPQGAAPVAVPSELAPPARTRRLSTPVLATIVAAAVVLIAGGVVLALILLSSSDVTVPDLVGVDAEDAESLLEEAGLAMKVENVSYSSFEEGVVVSQIPAAGQKLDKGASVTLEVNTVGGNIHGTTGSERDISSMAAIEASSIMAPDVSPVNYNPSNLVDNDYNTCWAEGNPGYGINDWVKFVFPQEVAVTKLSVVPGYLKISGGKDRWLQNGRLKTVDIVFDDGTAVNHTFADQKVSQDVNLREPEKTKTIMIIIRDVYPGQSGPSWTAAQDTSVSEIHVFGF